MTRKILLFFMLFFFFTQYNYGQENKIRIPFEILPSLLARHENTQTTIALLLHSIGTNATVDIGR